MTRTWSVDLKMGSKVTIVIALDQHVNHDLNTKPECIPQNSSLDSS